MNKAILMGRLTKDPEVRYSQGAEPIAVVRFSIAVRRSYRREGDPEADFLNCVAFGKQGEFINRYFKKGNMISVVGEIRTGSYTKNDGTKVYTTDIVVNESYFCESKASAEASRGSYTPPQGVSSAQDTPSESASGSSESNEFYKVEQAVDDDDLPF